MIQCTRCGAIMEDSAHFCGSCGGTEFVAATAGDGAMPNGGGMPQGNPAQGYQQPNYQQGNYQQQGAMPNYQQGPMPGYQQPGFQQPPNFFDPYGNVPPDVDRAAVSKSEFLNKYADPSLKKEWRNIAIFFYIASGFSILVAIIGMLAGWGDIVSVLFCLALLGLAMGAHLGVNKVCTIILLVLSCLDTLLSVVAYGTPSGWWWILVGAMAVSKINKINAQYKQFRSGMPMTF